MGEVTGSMLDSGTSHHGHLMWQQDITNSTKFVDTEVALAADQHTRIPEHKRYGELILPNGSDQLVSPGKLVQQVGMACTWLPTCSSHPSKYYLSNLKDSQVSRIHSILEETKDHIVPAVHHNIPYIEDDTANDLILRTRDAIDQRNVPNRLCQVDPYSFKSWYDKIIDLSIKLNRTVPPLAELSPWSKRVICMTHRCASRTVSEAIVQQIHYCIQAENTHDPEEVGPEDFDEVLEAAMESVMEDTKKGVTFGGTDTITFFDDKDYDDQVSVATDESKAELFYAKALHTKVMPLAPNGVPVFDDHLLTHTPYRDTCPVCVAGKRSRRPARRGNASGQDAPNAAGKHMLYVDWIEARTRSTNGHKWVCVVYFREKDLIYTKSYARKTGVNFQRCFIHALKEFKIEGEQYIVHLDRDTVHIADDTIAYIEQNLGMFWFGVQHAHNTNAVIENCVRKVQEAVKCLMYASGLPTCKWHHAVQYFWQAHNHQQGHSPLINTTPFMPFGILGKAIMPPEIGKKLTDKFESRGVPVVYLGPDPLCSGGVKVFFMNTTQRISTTTVMNRDIVWSSDMAFERKVIHLKELAKLFPSFDPSLGVQENQVACDAPGCGKWRFISAEQYAYFTEHPEEAATCVTVGYSCADPEDPRVWQAQSTLLGDYEEPPVGLNDKNGYSKVLDKNDFESDDESTAAPDSSDSEDEAVLNKIHAKLNKVGIPKEASFSDDLLASILLQKGGYTQSGGTSLTESALDQHNKMNEICTRLSFSATMCRITIGRSANAQEREMVKAVIHQNIDNVNHREHGVRDVRAKANVIKMEYAHRGEKIPRVMAIIVNNREALATDNPNKKEWIGAISKEVASLIDEGVLAVREISEVQPGDDLLPSLLILTRKPPEPAFPQGRYKARIVACGNFQSVSAAECYSSTVGHEVWMSVLLAALAQGHAAYQIDISTAFLQTAPEDDESRTKTFIRVPRGVEEVNKNVPTQKNHVWEVLKSIYGLRSAPKSWQRTLGTWLNSQGLTECPYDPSTYTDHSTGLVVLTYVDDLLIFGPPKLCEQFLDKLRKRFACSDAVALAKRTKEDPLLFLSHHIWVDNIEGKQTLCMSQRDYAQSIVDKFEDLSGVKPITSLYPEDFKQHVLSEGEPLSPERHKTYRSIVGGMMYLVLCSRIDLSAATHMLAEGQSSPHEGHWQAAMKLLRYLRHVPDQEFRLTIPQWGTSPTGTLATYFDANFAPEKSRSGGVITIDGQPVQWWSKKQRCLTLSTTEAELVSASLAAKETLGLRNLLTSIYPKLTLDCEIHGDNNAANLIADRQAGLRRVRHLTLSDLYVREACDTENLTVHRVDTTVNSSDILTKILGGHQMTNLRPLLRMFDGKTKVCCLRTILWNDDR